MVIQNDPVGSLSITAVLTNNGAAAIGLTKSGPGTLVMSATTNSYTGATTINGGVLAAAIVGDTGGSTGRRRRLGRAGW